MVRTASGRSKSQLSGLYITFDRNSELGPVLKYTSALAGFAR
jgi:hypothetical protein